MTHERLRYRKRKIETDEWRKKEILQRSRGDFVGAP